MGIPVIKKLSEAVPFCNIMVYGDPGVGKTVLAGSDKRVLFLAPENDGTLSAIRTGSQADKVDIRMWEDMRDAYDYFYAHPEICEEYDFFVIDSITELQYMARDYVLRTTAEEKKRKGHDPEAMQLQDYGTMHTLVENMVRGFNDLPVNILWTATAKKVEDTDANEFLVPEMQGKKEYGISMKMASLMTSYGYMRTELHQIPDGIPAEGQEQEFKTVKRRVIYWEDTGTIRGKDRTTRLAPFTVNATLQKIRLAINGDMVRDTNGFIVKPATNGSAPAKKAPAKKAPVQASPKPVEAVESTPAPQVVIAEDPKPADTDEKKEGEPVAVAVEIEA